MTGSANNSTPLDLLGSMIIWHVAHNFADAGTFVLFPHLSRTPVVDRGLAKVLTSPNPRGTSEEEEGRPTVASSSDQPAASRWMPGLSLGRLLLRGRCGHSSTPAHQVYPFWIPLDLTRGPRPTVVRNNILNVAERHTVRTFWDLLGPQSALRARHGAAPVGSR